MARDVALQMNRETVVAGAIIALEERDVWSVRREIDACREIVAAIRVIALLMRLIGADEPLSVERVFEACSGVDGVGRPVAAVNERACSAGREAAGGGGENA